MVTLHRNEWYCYFAVWDELDNCPWAHTKASGCMISGKAHLFDALKPNRCNDCDYYILICKINQSACIMHIII